MSDDRIKAFWGRAQGFGPGKPDPGEIYTLRDRIYGQAQELRLIVLDETEDSAAAVGKLTDHLRLEFELHGVAVEDVYFEERKTAHGEDGVRVSEWHVIVEADGTKSIAAYIRFYGDPNDEESQSSAAVFWSEDWLAEAVDLSVPEQTYFR